MRKKCEDCVIKHIAQAAVLLEESELGYPLHVYRAYGHLAEASSECEDPKLANQIRDVRKLIESGVPYDLMDLIKMIVGENKKPSGQDELSCYTCNHTHEGETCKLCRCEIFQLDPYHKAIRSM